MDTDRQTVKNMIYEMLCKLVDYGEFTGLLENEDRDYTLNKLLELFQLGEFTSQITRNETIYYSDLDNHLKPDEINKQIEVSFKESELNLEEILKFLLDYAFEQGILKENSITYRDLLDTKIMGMLVPRPSTIINNFKEMYAISPKTATEYHYKFSQDTDYIRRYRIKKDIRWISKTEYGDLDISINLSKPEKDPITIAEAKLAKQSGYPKCLLCKENVGYAGRIDHPARQNHRIIPVTIHGQSWGFQYSPYVYYNEHCIIFNHEHIPMQIEKATFRKLLDFVKQFPHYFVGSNADLPIVGGSILSHDHFQGGNYDFAMAKAPVERSFTVAGFTDVEAGIVTWPMSVIRLRSKSDDRLVGLADLILRKWHAYSDETVGIYAMTNGESHNTITPIARKRNDLYELDLVLRNNLTTKQYPLGVFHPHDELHHIKKENIGLIEVMGLAILPARLKDEMELLKKYILMGKDLHSDEMLEKHADWVDSFLPTYQVISKDNIDQIIQKEIGKVFLTVLEHAGVYKRTPSGQKAFDQFIKTTN